MVAKNTKNVPWVTMNPTKLFGISKHEGISYSMEYTSYVVSCQGKRMHVNVSMLKIRTIRQNNTKKQLLTGKTIDELMDM